MVFYFTGTVVRRIGRQLMEMCVDIREISDQNLTQILPSGPKISAKNDASEISWKKLKSKEKMKTQFSLILTLDQNNLRQCSPIAT